LLRLGLTTDSKFGCSYLQQVSRLQGAEDLGHQISYTELLVPDLSQQLSTLIFKGDSFFVVIADPKV
jgi:hypothetical protein